MSVHLVKHSPSDTQDGSGQCNVLINVCRLMKICNCFNRLWNVCSVAVQAVLGYSALSWINACPVAELADQHATQWCFIAHVIKPTPQRWWLYTIVMSVCLSVCLSVCHMKCFTATLVRPQSGCESCRVATSPRVSHVFSPMKPHEIYASK